MWPQSLRGRLFIMIILPLIVLAALAAAVRYKFAEATSRQLYDDTLSVVALTISRDVVLSEGDMLAEQLLDSLTGALGDAIFYRVTGPKGRFLTGYTDAPPVADEESLPTGVPIFFDSIYYGDPVRVVVMREFIAEPEIGGWTTVQVWQTVSQREQLSLMLFYQAAGLMAVVIIAASGLVWFAIDRGLQPLTSLRAAIASRSPSDLKRINRPVPSEVKPVVQAMNSLFERLAAAFAQRDAFISNAAHQLRNPIAAIQAQAEATEGAPSEAEMRARAHDVAEAARRASRLTQQLLSLDKVRGRQQANPDMEVDLPALARDVMNHVAPAALRRGTDLSFDVAGNPRRLSGDAVMLSEALDNLLDNALRYGCASGGAVAVRIQFHLDDVVTVVQDSGPGVPVHLRELVFERFQRGVDDGVDGCGLGLPIVREVAKRHGGTIRLAKSDKGARFELRLPLQTQNRSPQIT